MLAPKVLGVLSPSWNRRVTEPEHEPGAVRMNAPELNTIFGLIWSVDAADVLLA